MIQILPPPLLLLLLILLIPLLLILDTNKTVKKKITVNILRTEARPWQPHLSQCLLRLALSGRLDGALFADCRVVALGGRVHAGGRNVGEGRDAPTNKKKRLNAVLLPEMGGWVHINRLAWPHRRRELGFP